MDAGITSGAMLADGGLVLATQAGELLYSQDDGATFKTARLTQQVPIFGISAASDGRVGLAGPTGVGVEAMPR